MTNPYNLPLSTDTFDSEEREAILRVFDSGRYTMGDYVKRFESEFAEFCGSKHAIMVNSGSSANLVMMNALALRGESTETISSKKDILVSGLLWPTTLWPIIQSGFNPVLVDISLDSLNMCPLDLKAKLTDDSCGVFYIHVLGNPSNVAEISQICDENNLFLLEDCCESLGAQAAGNHVGNFGVAGSFSHFFSHHISTMEGGTIVTNEDSYADLCRSFRAHGWIRDRSDYELLSKRAIKKKLDPRWTFVTPGFNLRPTEIQGAIGSCQLRKLPKMLSQRSNFVKVVNDIMLGNELITLIGFDDIDRTSRHSWMNIPFLVNEPYTHQYGNIIEIFERNGVETRPLLTGDFRQQDAIKFVPSFVKTNLPNLESASARGFMISAFPANKNDAVICLTKILKEISNI